MKIHSASQGVVMIKRLVIALLAATSAMSVWAQAPKVVGKFANLTGLVTVSSGDSLSSAVNGGVFAVGNRVVTTSSGGVTLKFDNGCDLTLNANESVTVDENNQCKLAAIPTRGQTMVAAGAGGNFVPFWFAGGGALAVILTTQKNTKISGS
ncbi:MAG TPA: hypothetical protein VN303_07375 [Pseudomonas sp.]|jgi:hypothetical protein|nr:hypothetical protein [Pseudomonas sp.]